MNHEKNNDTHDPQLISSISYIHVIIQVCIPAYCDVSVHATYPTIFLGGLSTGAIMCSRSIVFTICPFSFIT
jgi:hypothetical protein